MISMKKSILLYAWVEIENAYKQYHEKYPTLEFRYDKFDDFSNLFITKYEDIMDRFMKEDTEALDAHKQAALLTVCCLELKIVEHKIDDPEKISIIPQLIAINVGLSYMLDCLNAKLFENGIIKKIEEYYFPVAIACETPYMEIMCRILYHEQTEQDMSFNVLELADRYFLLEYITLLQRRIEPALLKDQSRASLPHKQDNIS